MANMRKFLGFLADNTRDMQSVCELGAGRFENMPHYKCPRRIGIELIHSYIEARLPGNWLALWGNALDYDKILLSALESFPDVFALIDFLEHLDKADGIALLQRLQQTAKRIIIFAPHGTCNQSGAESFGFGDEKCAALVKERGEGASAAEAQRHKSSWYTEDLTALGFTVDCDKNYHSVTHTEAQIGKDGGAVIFAVWNKV